MKKWRGFITIEEENMEIVEHLREYLKVMESEPAEDLIKLKDVYHNLKRMLGDE